MATTPDPVWPVIVLAAISFVDGLFCLGPVAFVRQCLLDVRFPERYWKVLSPLKFAATVGLIAGIRVPYLGLLTTVALILYFLVAIASHLRARDFGRNLFVNATGMLVLCVLTLLVSFSG